MGRIIDYPYPARLVTDTDVVAAWMDGKQVQVPTAAITRQAVGAATSAAAGYASAAALAAATAMAASRYFPSRAAGEAASVADQLFSTDDGAGSLIYYRRTANGSLEIGRAITPATLGSVGGASLVGFGQRTVSDRLQDTLSVKDFIKGNSSGDLGAVLNQMIREFGPNGGIIEVPPAFSNFLLTTPFESDLPVLLRGGAHRSCSILCTTANVSCFTFSNWFAIEGLEFTLIGDAADTSIAIKGLAASAGHNGSRVIHSRITGGKIGIHHERANELTIDDVTLGSYTQYGVLLENTTNSDEGDNHVCNITLAGGADPAAVGLYAKDAGLYGTANKVNGVHTIGVLIEASSGDVGDINWHGGSIEGATGSSFRVQTENGRQVTKVQVIGVQFSAACDCHLDLAGTLNNVVAAANIYNGDVTITTAVRIGASARAGILASSEFHALLKGIELNSGGGGWTVDHSNRFADDVVWIFTGPSGTVPNNPPTTSDIRLSLGRYVETASATDWVNVFSWNGMGEFRYQIGEVVQGGGVGAIFGSGYFLASQTAGATQQLLPAAALLDAQVINNGGGGCVLQVKKHSFDGTTADVTVKLELVGNPDQVVRA